MSKEEMKGTQLTPGAVAPGTFEDHMQGHAPRRANSSTQPATQPVPSVLEFKADAEAADAARDANVAFADQVSRRSGNKPLPRRSFWSPPLSAGRGLGMRGS